jgi:hypothetical protein
MTRKNKICQNCHDYVERVKICRSCGEDRCEVCIDTDTACCEDSNLKA